MDLKGLRPQGIEAFPRKQHNKISLHSTAAKQLPRTAGAPTPGRTAAKTAGARTPAEPAKTGTAARPAAEPAPPHGAAGRRQMAGDLLAEDNREREHKQGPHRQDKYRKSHCRAKGDAHGQGDTAKTGPPNAEKTAPFLPQPGTQGQKSYGDKEGEKKNDKYFLPQR